MGTALVTHDEYLLHDNGPLHPERPQRLRAVWTALHNTGLLPRLTFREPALATADEIARAHEPQYVDLVREIAERGGGFLDGDTPVGEESYRIALLSAGGGLTATRAVLAGEYDNAFLASRPPGHHACRGKGMGFCLFNNIAIAAHEALAQGLERVFILDWDVHHGNGTQDVFYRDPRVFFCSLHQMSWYPFTGASDETGEGAGVGTTLNLPLRPGRRDKDYLELLDTVVADAAHRFAPQLFLVSAGQDTHERDPLGQMRVTSAGFGQMTQRVLDWAAALCDNRVVVAMEGGYDLEGLSGGVVNIVGRLLGDSEAPA